MHGEVRKPTYLSYSRRCSCHPLYVS